ncbi:hypothetical protein ACL02R_11590 [Streptomyces sp. MS19]|uniref:hypothetical protein n=1 Tax=Streptomyces sp. MS19 TaxID=3385972 RepID=UPI0039A1A730
MHDPDFETFILLLADALPGTWTGRYHPDADHTFARLTADVWDMNLIADALARSPLTECATLTDTDGTRLFVMANPTQNNGFLIATMAPALPTEAFRDVREPDGIAVPDDPLSAARSIAWDLLPRYRTAVARVRDNARRPPSSDDTLVLTWSGRSLRTPRPQRPDVAALLAEYGFNAGDDDMVLPGDDPAVQAAFLQTLGTRLAALGIGLALRTATSAPTATVPVQRGVRASEFQQRAR